MFVYSVIYDDPTETAREFVRQARELEYPSDKEAIEDASKYGKIIRIHNVTREKTIYSYAWSL